MDAFWHFARLMLRYRATIVWAMVFAALSAGGLGIGLVAIAPVLENILNEGARGLPDVAEAYNANMPALLSWARLPRPWIDALPTGQFTAVVAILSVLGVLTLLGGLANFLHAYLSLTVVYRTVTNIRREAFHRVVRLPLKRVVTGGATDLVSRIVNDTNQLSQGFATLLSRTVAQVAKGIAAFAAALFLSPLLVLMALPVTVLLYIVIRRLGKKIRRASRGALRSQAGLYASTTEVLQGLRVVKVFTTERYEAGRFHRINKQFMKEMMRVRVARALSSPLVEVLSLFAMGLVSLIAAKAIIDDKLDLEIFIATLVALGAAGASLKPLTGLVNEIQASSAAAQRIRELMDEQAEPGHDSRLPKLQRHAESVELDRVTFTYPGANRPALRDVSLKIRHGERVAIVGPNGCGKTTLLALVPRLFDPDPGENGAPGGRVMLDGCDVRDYSVRSLRRQIGVVTQETVIFQGTIAGNIAYGAEGATPERIEAAARKARAHEFVSRLPKGYETGVGEQGLTLSGGQRQRIAIARAILRDPAILILDEATSMIDGESEAKIAEAIAEFSQERTCLIVAHRLSTVLSADRIVVMSEGRVVDEGRHQELLGRCEVYRQLFERR
ncbi:MAG TPA: ABC transporter ATP-binding protein [Phycisphaerales bacterium]|nr:ABC transporter ATP-binding protein [Phycisphaerales bacterium]